MSSSVAPLLKTRRKDLNLSIREVIAKLHDYGVDVSDKTLYGWENGHRQPDADTFIILCQIYQISSLSGIKNPPSDISAEAKQIAQDYEKLSDHGKGAVRAILQYEGAAAVKKKDEPVSIHGLVKVIELPHAWDKASAGKGFDLSDSRMDTWKIIYNDDTRRADFCVDVDGSSMEPLYHNGDVLLIRRQPSVDIGEVGLFIVDGLGYVKRQAEDRLESINPEFPDIYPGEYSSVECMGKVIGILQDDWIVQS